MGRENVVLCMSTPGCHVALEDSRHAFGNLEFTFLANVSSSFSRDDKRGCYVPCHSCHKSASVPKHTDFRQPAHRLEKERCNHRIVVCVQSHLQAQGKQAGRIDPCDCSLQLGPKVLLIKLAAPWPLSTSDVSCRRVGALVAQEPAEGKTDLQQAESSVYALRCLFLFLIWEMTSAAHGRGTQGVRSRN